MSTNRFIRMQMNKKPPMPPYDEVRALCSELPALEERLHRAGLHKTARALNAATKLIGFEAEEMLSAHTKGKA